MSDLKAQLEITADASGVEVGTNKAKRSLADLGVTAANAGKKASAGLGEIGKGGDAAAAKVDSSTRSLINSIERTTAAMEAGSKTGSEYFKVLARQRGVSQEDIQPALDRLEQTAAKQSKVAITAGQMSNALRGVPAQFTDIITSLQGGQAPLTVFLQQGGQLKDLFGGVGPAAKALGGYIVGLVNPFTIAAGAAAALAIAYEKGSQEADEYAKALILSGNAAGLTVDQLQSMAQRIDAVTGTQAAAAEALTQFAAASHIARDSIEQFSTVALRMQTITGQAVSETVKQFEELGKSPVEASIKLNEKTNYLTASLYQQIKALEDQGRAADAAALAQDAYAKALDTRLTKVDEHLGILQATWRGVTNVAKEAWDAMLDVGRAQPITDKINEVNDALVALEKSRPSAGSLFANRRDGLDYESRRKELLLQLQSLQYSQQQAEIDANSAKAIAEKARARMQFDNDGAQFMSNQAKMAKEIEKAQNEGLKAGASQLEINKRIADIKDKYNKNQVTAGLQIDKSKLGADISAIEKALDQLNGSYANSQKIIDAQHSAGLISDRDYYAQKRAYVELSAQAEEDALNKEIARYGKENLSGQDAINNKRKIAEAESKIAVTRADASAKLAILNNQEINSTNQLKLSYLTARQAAQDYFDTLQRQQNRQLAGLGKGQQQRDKDAGINQIEDRYAQQRLELANQKALLEAQKDGDGNSLFTASEKKKYDERLALLDEFQGKSIASYAAYYQKILKEQGEWSVGASEAMNNYLNDSRNVAKQTAELFTDAFRGMEDSLVDFVKTGKLSFTDFANAVIDGLIRIQIKKIAVMGSGALPGLLGSAISAFGGGTSAAASIANILPGDSLDNFLSLNNNFAGARALGGPVSAGGLYEVNEKGPELLSVGNKQYLMMGNNSGSVTPNGGGGTSVQISIDARGTSVQGNNSKANQLGKEFEAAVNSVIIKQRRPGGLLT